MTDLEMWSLIIGVVAPLVYAIVQQPKWRPWLRALVTILLTLLVAAGTAYFNHDFDGRSWLSSVLLVFVAAITSYHGLWKPTGIAPAIERTTSGAPTAPQDTPEAEGAV